MKKLVIALVAICSFSAFAEDNVCQKKAQANLASISSLKDFSSKTYDINEGTMINGVDAYNIYAQIFTFNFTDSIKPETTIWRHYCKCNYVTYNYDPYEPVESNDGKKKTNIDRTSIGYSLVCNVEKEEEKAKY